MKYYIYVSDTKVDMLYAQIPQGIKKKIATEIKIDLKILSTTFKDKEKVDDNTRYSRLNLVVDYIEKHLSVGSIDKPASYFRGVMPMYWGMLDGPNSDGIAYFGGEDNNNIVVLGGSTNHLLGNQSDKDSGRFSSITFGLIKFFNTYLEQERRMDNDNRLLENLLNDELSFFSSTVKGDNLSKIERISKNINRDMPFMKLAHSNLEFMARNLINGEGNMVTGQQVILGTPLYVAFADET